MTSVVHQYTGSEPGKSNFACAFSRSFNVALNGFEPNNRGVDLFEKLDDFLIGVCRIVKGRSEQTNYEKKNVSH